MKQENNENISSSHISLPVDHSFFRSATELQFRSYFATKRTPGAPFFSPFRNYKQELYLLDAFNRKDINGMEQNRNSLISISQQAIAKLDTLKSFNKDRFLVTTCRKVVEFHKAEAENQIPGLSDYLMKTDSFDKIRKAFESKAPAKRTQADIDSYNASVADINKAVENSNKILAVCNQGRNKTLDNWNITVKKFMNYHMPNKKLQAGLIFQNITEDFFLTRKSFLYKPFFSMFPKDFTQSIILIIF